MHVPVRDAPTVTASGAALTGLPAGVITRDATTHTDERGWLVEAFDPRWDVTPEPLTRVRLLEVAPGAEHESTGPDRWFILEGEAEVAIDGEAFALSYHHRRLAVLPGDASCAIRTLGPVPALLLAFPSGPAPEPAPPVTGIELPRGAVLEPCPVTEHDGVREVEAGAGAIPYAYVAHLREGWVKGWGLHERHDDRYVVLDGAMRVVLHDARPDSPTHDLVSVIELDARDPHRLRIPAGVWHADHGHASSASLLNMPTQPYDHADPDKFRLPVHNDVIPYRFPAGTPGG